MTAFVSAPVPWRTIHIWPSSPFWLGTTIWSQSACIWLQTWYVLYKPSLWNLMRACITKTQNRAVRSAVLGYVKTWGQVDFVLSDKTGTLTQNEMCFKACYVDGQTYGYWSENARWFPWSRRREYKHRVLFLLSKRSHRETSTSKRLHAS